MTKKGENLLEEAIEDCNKRFGKGTVMPLNESRASEPVDVISTRCIVIDEATGIGGIPRGRITEVYGPESGGKTTLCLQLIAEAQSRGGKALFIDAENALDMEYAKALGVDVDSLLCTQPSSGEEALEIADALINTGQIAIVVVDSVAALVPRAELEGEMGDSMMGLHARLMSQAMRKLNHSVKVTGTALVFINQIRDKIGQVWGNPETTSGGRALKFFSSMRIDVRRTGSKKKGDEIVANETKVKIVKNKLAAPFKTAELLLVFGKGFQS